MPRTEATTGGSSSATPSGPAGGDLTGTYPDPTIGAGKVTNAKLADMAAKTVKMRHTNSTGAPEDTTMANLWTDLSGQAGASVAMNGQKFTGLAAGTTAGDSVRYEQSAQSILTAKGDVLTASAANTPARLAVGANSQVLMADSSASTGNKWFGGAWSSTYDIVNIASVQNMMSQSIPANTLGANGALFGVVNGFYLNNSGASRGLTLRVAFGAPSNMWFDATSATYFGASATAYPFYMEFLLCNEGATNAQRLSGMVRIGQATAGSTAGVGSLSQSGDVASTPFHGTAAYDTTSAGTLLVSAQHSTNNSSLQLKGTVHVWVVV